MSHLTVSVGSANGDSWHERELDGTGRSSAASRAVKLSLFLLLTASKLLNSINSTYGADASVGSTVALNKFQCKVCNIHVRLLADTLAEQ